MAKPAVVRVVAETRQYDKSIDNAAKRLNDFGKNGVSSLTSLAGSWGKLVPAVGAAVGAHEIFDRCLKSSQALGDAFAVSQAQCAAVVDNFFVTLTSGDWTAFNAGLDSMIRKAGLAQAAIDQLGNSTMSLTVSNAKDSYELQKQMTILRGTKKGTDEYNKALEEYENIVNRMRGNSKVVQGDIVDAITKNLSAQTALNSNEISFDWIMKAQTVDSQEEREAMKQKARHDVDIYQRARKIIEDRYMESGGSVGAGGQVSFTREFKEGADVKAYQREIAALNARYGESITIVTMLDRMTDEQLKNVNDQTVAYWNLSKSVEQSETQLARLSKEDNGGGGKPTKPEEAPIENSLGYYNQKLAEANKALLSAADQEAYNAAMAIVEQYKRAIDRIKGEGDMDLELSEPTEVKTGKDMLAEAAGGKLDTTGVKKAYKSMQQYNDQLAEAKKNHEAMLGSVGSLGGAMAQLGSTMEGTASSLVRGIGDIMASIAAAIPALEAMSIAEGTETATRSSNNYIEAIAAIAAVAATVISTFSQLPAFAEGTWTDKPTVGVFGEAGPEFVLPEKKLDEAFKRNGASGGGGQLQTSLSGEQILIALNRHGKRTGKGNVKFG